MSSSEANARDVVKLILLLALISALFIGFDRLDHSGWIPHSSHGQVYYPSHGWEVGQYITCGISAPGAPKDKEPSLGCNEEDFTGTLREMDVRIWGRVGMDVRFFQCQRTEDLISCHLPKD
jgi:hypothetical protein